MGSSGSGFESAAAISKSEQETELSGFWHQIELVQQQQVERHDKVMEMEKEVQILEQQKEQDKNLTPEQLAQINKKIQANIEYHGEGESATLHPELLDANFSVRELTNDDRRQWERYNQLAKEEIISPKQFESAFNEFLKYQSTVEAGSRALFANFLKRNIDGLAAKVDISKSYLTPGEVQAIFAAMEKNMAFRWEFLKKIKNEMERRKLHTDEQLKKEGLNGGLDQDEFEGLKNTFKKTFPNEYKEMFPGQ